MAGARRGDPRASGAGLAPRCGGRGLRADEAGRDRLRLVGQALSPAAGPSVAFGQFPTLEAMRAGIATGAGAGLPAAPAVTSDS